MPFDDRLLYRSESRWVFAIGFDGKHDWTDDKFARVPRFYALSWPVAAVGYLPADVLMDELSIRINLKKTESTRLSPLDSKLWFKEDQ